MASDSSADTQLAVQLFTLRDYTKTVGDLAATFRKLADQGWRSVQVSAVGVNDPKEIKKVLDDHGLSCCATHPSPGQKIWEDPAALIDELAILDCQYTAIGGYFPSEAEFTKANWQAWIDRFNGAAPKYADAPVRVGYHNHSHELAKVGGKNDIAGPTAWDMLTGQLHESVWFEIDTYWIAHGGECPAQTIRDLAGRVPCVHLKDLAITPAKEPYMAEVGVGNLNWPGVLDACKSSAVEWYIVEQDTCYRDPFDSLKTSLDNLHAMGLR
ncbi:MAG: sugar phosphate isomerase/epimerase [Planctomycetota bacterium]